MTELEEGRPDLKEALARWLHEREYMPLWHLLAVFGIFFAAALLFNRNLGCGGTMMYTDMTWPAEISRLQFNAANAWMPYGSYPVAGSQLWFYWIYPTAAIARLFHLSSATYQLLMFWGTFTLAGVSMYVLAFSTIRSLGLPGTARCAPCCGAVLAALVFMYNPWSLMYLREYFGYPVYALSPLLFLAMARTFESPRLRNIVLFSLFVVLVNTSHHLVWFWALFISYLLFFVLTNRFTREKVISAVKVLGGTLVSYLLLGAGWILPYVGSQVAGNPLVPYYHPGLSRASVEALSANNTIANNLRLVSFGAWSLETVDNGVFLEVLAFTLPVLAVLSFLLLRERVKRSPTVNYWAAVAALALLLATGSSFILKRYFIYLTFDAPFAGFYGWMLRATERWLFFVPVFFGLMIGIMFSSLLVSRKQPYGIAVGSGRASGAGTDPGWRGRASRMAAASAVAVVTIVSLVPVANWFARTVFSPAAVPPDYRKVNEFLARRPDGNRVAWVPFFPSDGYVYKWAPEKKIGPYSILSSPPSLSSIQAVTDEESYFKWLESLYRKKSLQSVQMLKPELMLGRDEMSRLFAPFGTRYVVLDTSVKGYDFGGAFDEENSIRLVYETGALRVYEVDHNRGYMTVATTTVKAGSFFDNLSLPQAFAVLRSEGLAFFNGRSYFGGAPGIPKEYGVVDLDDYLIPLTMNGGFELEQAGEPHPGWYLSYDNGKTTLTTVDDSRASSGKSLMVVNRSAAKYDMSWVSTWEQQVSRGEMYAFETSIKCWNVDSSFAAVEGMSEKTGLWEPMITCPGVQSGDAGWKTYRCSLTIPAGISRIRPALGAGWVKKRLRGPAVTLYDSVMLSRVGDGLAVALGEKRPAPSIAFKKLSAGKYGVRIRGASAPFVLVLSETYDGLWVAETREGREIEAVPMYATVNGFPVDGEGSFELTIRYKLQEWVSAGLVISVSAMLVFAVYLIHAFRERLSALACATWNQGGRRRGRRNTREGEGP